MIAFFANIPPDPDAEAYLAATGITNPTISVAVSRLVRRLKSAGVWTKIIAAYPMKGGTLDTCKYNLKDPRDLDAAFRLTFMNAPSVDADGVIWNGVNQYADTHYIPSVQLPATMHHGYYGISEPGGTSPPGIEMGASRGGGVTRLSIRSSLPTMVVAMRGIFTPELAKGTTSSLGFVMITDESSTLVRGVRNGVDLGTATQTAGNYSAIDVPILVGATGRFSPIIASEFSHVKCGFALFGQGMSVAEMQATSHAVNEFMTNLGANTY